MVVLLLKILTLNGDGSHKTIVTILPLGRLGYKFVEDHTSLDPYTIRKTRNFFRLSARLCCILLWSTKLLTLIEKTPLNTYLCRPYLSYPVLPETPSMSRVCM